MPGCYPIASWMTRSGLTDTGADALADARTGKNGRHRLAGLLRQSVFGRLAGYEDVNDADRLCRDPAMRWVVGDRAITGSAASASQMGRFETKWLSRPENLAALADLPGQWIDKVHHAATAEDRRARHGFEREPDLRRRRKAAPTTAISAAPATTRCSCSTSSAIWSGVRCGRATCTAPMVGARCWSRWWPVTGAP